MYDFVDKGGRHVALRPELTASICRAFVQHRPPLPWKVWCAGPQFRYEKPQRGRFRQFDQVDVEVLGVDDPHLDVEVIALGWRFFEALGLRQVTLLLNSLGEPADRARYVDALRRHFDADRDELSAESRETLERNPLRVLDSKRRQDAELIAAAPSFADFWSDDAAAHFDDRARRPRRARHPVPGRAAARPRARLLPAHDVRVRRRHARQRPERARRRRPLRRARRGVGRAADTGHRLRHRPRPHADRVRRRRASSPPSSRPLDVFVVDTTGGGEALAVTEQLRRAGRSADRAFDGRSMRAQMKAADRSGASVAVIIGDDELAAGTAVVRPLRGDEPQTVGRPQRPPHPPGRALQ